MRAIIASLYLINVILLVLSLYNFFLSPLEYVILRVFGCIYFVLFPLHQHDKLHAKTVLCFTCLNPVDKG